MKQNNEYRTRNKNTAQTLKHVVSVERILAKLSAHFMTRVEVRETKVIQIVENKEVLYIFTMFIASLHLNRQSIKDLVSMLCVCIVINITSIESSFKQYLKGFSK